MVIEVPVRKEILNYQEKLFFGFSLRQFISVGMLLVIVVPMGVLNHIIWQFSIDDIGIGLMVICAPILSIGWLKPNHLPIEKYIQIRWNYFKLADYYTYSFESEVKSSDVIFKKEKKRQRKQPEYGN